MYIIRIIIITLIIAFGPAMIATAGIPANTANTPQINAQDVFSNEQPSQDTSTSTNKNNNGLSPMESMLKGSLLGNFLFGLPFEKAALVDIVVLLMFAFVISKIISRPSPKGSAGAGDQTRSNWPHDQTPPSGPAAPPAGFDPWSRLRGKQDQSKKGKTIPFPGTKTPNQNDSQPISSAHQAEPASSQQQTDEEFIKGAKVLFIRLHEAWKKQDLTFIEHFTSPSIYQSYLAANPEDFMDIVKVDAKVIKQGRRNGDPFITVEFTALAHKNKAAGPPTEIKETWAFLEPSITGSWRLEEKL